MGRSTGDSAAAATDTGVTAAAPAAHQNGSSAPHDGPKEKPAAASTKVDASASSAQPAVISAQTPPAKPAPQPTPPASQAPSSGGSGSDRPQSARGRGRGGRGMRRGAGGRGAGRDAKPAAASSFNAKHDTKGAATGSGSVPGIKEWTGHGAQDKHQDKHTDSDRAGAAEATQAAVPRGRHDAENAGRHAHTNGHGPSESHANPSGPGRANAGSPKAQPAAAQSEHAAAAQSPSQPHGLGEGFSNLKVSVGGSGARKVVVVGSTKDRRLEDGAKGFIMRDPTGTVVGPFTARELVQWFDEGLQIKESGSHGGWEHLRQCLSRLRRQMGSTAPPAGDKQDKQGPKESKEGKDAGGGSRSEGKRQQAKASSQSDEVASGQPQEKGAAPSHGKQAQGGAGAGAAPAAASAAAPAAHAPPNAKGKGHKRDKSMGGSDHPPKAAPSEKEKEKGKDKERADKESSKGAKEHGRDRGQAPSAQTHGGGANGHAQGGGAGHGRSNGRAQITDAVVHGLFTGGCKLAAEEPVWRYVDNSENVQGPWTSRQMISWYKQGYFDKNLLVVGCERKLAPPNLPKRSEYRPLGQLLQEKSEKMPNARGHKDGAPYANGHGHGHGHHGQGRRHGKKGH